MPYLVSTKYTLIGKSNVLEDLIFWFFCKLVLIIVNSNNFTLLNVILGIIFFY